MVIDVLQKSKDALQDFLSKLTLSMDFELGSKTNPKDLDGNVKEGRYEVLSIYRRQGLTSKSLMAYLILYPITAEDKVISSKLEEPIENELRLFIKGMTTPIGTPTPTPPTPTPTTPSTNAGANIVYFLGEYKTRFTKQGNQWIETLPSGAYWSTFNEETRDNQYIYIFDPARQIRVRLPIYGGIASLTEDGKIWTPIQSVVPMFVAYRPPEQQPTPSQPTPTPSQPTPTTPSQPRYVRYKGSPNVFDRYNGRYISYSEAQQLGIFNAGMVQDIDGIRPEVKVATDFALWDGKNLTIYPV